MFAISLHENVQLSLQTVFAYIRLFFFRNIQNCFDSRNKMYSANYINSSHHNVIQGDGIFLSDWLQATLLNINIESVFHLVIIMIIFSAD